MLDVLTEKVFKQYIYCCFVAVCGVVMDANREQSVGLDIVLLQWTLLVQPARQSNKQLGCATDTESHRCKVSG